MMKSVWWSFTLETKQFRGNITYPGAIADEQQELFPVEKSFSALCQTTAGQQRSEQPVPDRPPKFTKVAIEAAVERPLELIE